MRYILFKDISGEPLIRKYYHSRGQSSVSKDDYWMTDRMSDAHVFQDIHEAINIAKWVYDSWQNELTIKVMYE